MSLEADSEQRLLETLEAEKSRRLIEDKLKYYRPYPKQAEFHAAGAKHRERLLMAGNQIGKTWCRGMEAAMHATGRYSMFPTQNGGAPASVMRSARSLVHRLAGRFAHPFRQ